MLCLYKSLRIRVPIRHALATGYGIEGSKVGIGLARGQHHLDARAIALAASNMPIPHPAQIETIAGTNAGPGTALNPRPAWPKGVLRENYSMLGIWLATF